MFPGVANSLYKGSQVGKWLSFAISGDVHTLALTDQLEIYSFGGRDIWTAGSRHAPRTTKFAY